MSRVKAELSHPIKVKIKPLVSKTEKNMEVDPLSNLDDLQFDRTIRRLLDPYWAGRLQLRPF